MHRKHQPTAKRNTEIFRLRQEGSGFRHIANIFNISTCRVAEIFRREKKRVEWAERSVCLQWECRVINDIDRKMPIEDLFCLFSFPVRISMAVRNHLRGKGIQEYSLRDMMEFLIPKVPAEKVSNFIMPACGIAGIGKKYYAEMIMAMSSKDCGEWFQREWDDRKDLLKDYLDGIGKDWHALFSPSEILKHSFPLHSFQLAASNNKVHILLPKGEEILLWNAKTSPSFPPQPSLPDCFPPAGAMPPVNVEIFDTHQ
jgi:hypothetical protein